MRGQALVHHLSEFWFSRFTLTTQTTRSPDFWLFEVFTFSFTPIFTEDQKCVHHSHSNFSEPTLTSFAPISTGIQECGWSLGLRLSAFFLHQFSQQVRNAVCFWTANFLISPPTFPTQFLFLFTTANVCCPLTPLIFHSPFLIRIFPGPRKPRLLQLRFWPVSHGQNVTST